MAQHTYLVVHPDGRFERIVRASPILLDDLEGIIGGSPEHVMVTREICAYCHEMGRLEGLPSNAAYPNMAGAIVFCREDPRGLFCGLGLRDFQLEAIEQHNWTAATIYASPVQTIHDFGPTILTGEAAVEAMMASPFDREIMALKRHDQVAIIRNGVARVMGPDAVTEQLFEVDVPADGLKRWMNGEAIQVAMPHVPKEVREFLLSGTSPATWNDMFPSPPQVT